MKINWSYYYDEISDRAFYILGFFLLVFLPFMKDWILIGDFVRNAQSTGVLPENANMASVLGLAAVFAIFAASWDLMSGFSGQISFGHALFFGMGGYLSIKVKHGMVLYNIEVFPGIVNNFHDLAGIRIDIGMLQAIFIAAFITMFLATMLGILTLRLKGPYFALVTLVLPLIARVLVTKIWKNEAGGDLGLPKYGSDPLKTADLIDSPSNPDFTPLENLEIKAIEDYKVILPFLIITVGIMYFLGKSRYGLMLKAIREDELAASSSGINVGFYKVSVIGISAFFAAIAGSLLVQIGESASSSIFDTERSFQVIIFSILGGIGTITGAVVGAFLLTFSIENYLNEALIAIPTVETLVLSLFLIFSLRYQPRGIIRAQPQFRNSLVFSSVWSVFWVFYESGEIFSSFLKTFDPADILINLFGDNENGLMYIDISVVQGRILFYFIIGVVIGYFFPELYRKVRLKTWGVWPNLGKFDPPT
ncbi:MAG: hypothetical protein HeimC2_36080 [Candidatus Heimdallarchaeota archaeon LC_2]|nr:MAG: hypothetical protein HeimC2_36080 [Candidatus Heimdallarchaeota archaeon LC_2]